MMKLLLNAHNIQKKFYSPIEVSVLNNISLLLHEGESIAIMGASGEGKSTLLQILGTLEAPTNGSIEILGKKVSERSSNSIRNQHIGFVFQGYNLLADYTALQNVLMPALIAGNDISKNSQSYSRALELLSHVGLDDRAHFQTKLLSGGEKQPVAIALSLIHI